MKFIAVVAAASLLTAVVATPALAGKPDDPGSVSAQDDLAAAQAADMTLGQVNRAIDQELMPNFGQTKKEAHPQGWSNPHNDNGKGNDW
jgi:hypothetical protein